MKRLVCVTRVPTCPDCLLYRSCIFPYLFETPPPLDAELLRKYPAAPHPYILWFPKDTPAGRNYELGLTLAGRANSYLAYVVRAIRTAESRPPHGLPPLQLEQVLEEEHPGSGRWRDIFDRRTSQLSPSLPASPIETPPPTVVRIHLLTPLRLRHEERYVSPRTFTPGDLLRSIIRRISLLEYFHGEGHLPVDFAALSQRSHHLSMSDSNLQWREWTRYSNRQGRKVEMGGLVGQFTLHLSGFEDFWPWLSFGQWVHAGKGTVMGLGAFRIDPLACQKGPCA